MHPQRLSGFERSFCAFGTTLCIALLTGCGTDVPGSGTDSNLRPVDPSTDNNAVGNVAEDGILNDLFDQAQPATMKLDGSITITGSITERSDIDIYALGPAAAGDRVIIDIKGDDGLNTVAGLFDAGFDLIDANNDRSYYAGQLDPYIAQIIRADTDALYLGVAVSESGHFTSSSGQYDNGTYSITVLRQPDSVVSPARQQVVWLDFEGGDRVQIGLEPVETMRPFSVESITNRLDGSTDYVITKTLEFLRADYAAYDVVLLDSQNHTQPAEPCSKVYFGNYSAAFLGLADSVDTGNKLLQQEAIVYAEDLALFESLQPTADEIAQALANIAGHELGHLLGLEHAIAAPDLMATAASARQILEIDHGFYRSQLESLVFPIGYQNAPQLLLLNVGANPDAAPGARVRLADVTVKLEASWRDLLDENKLPTMMCGNCGGAHCDNQQEHNHH